MKRIVATAGLALSFVALGCASPRTSLEAIPPPVHVRAADLARVPTFIVMPAVDRRPTSERAGDSAELGYMMASTGGAMSRTTGASVLAGDDGLRWRQRGFSGLPSSPNTAAAADLADAIKAASERPVMLVADLPERAATLAVDGTVIVILVIDHVAKITAQNHDFSQTKHQEGNYEVTTTTTLTESFGPFWTFTFRIQLNEVRGGRIVRRLVRYAATTSTNESAYSDAISLAAAEIVDAVASEWSTSSPVVVDDDGVAEGL